MSVDANEKQTSAVISERKMKSNKKREKGKKREEKVE